MISPLFKVTGEEAKGLLYGLLEVDKFQLRQHPEWPSVRSLIRDGKIQYEEYDPDEHWQTTRELMEQIGAVGVAKGDCEDIAVAMAADDQVRHGIESLPYAYSPKAGLFHVVTAVPKHASASFGGAALWPKASMAPPVYGYELQDPSAAAGMKVSFSGLRGKDLGKARIDDACCPERDREVYGLRSPWPTRRWYGALDPVLQAADAFAQAMDRLGIEVGEAGWIEEGTRYLVRVHEPGGWTAQSFPAPGGGERLVSVPEHYAKVREAASRIARAPMQSNVSVERRARPEDPVMMNIEFWSPGTGMSDALFAGGDNVLSSDEGGPMLYGRGGAHAGGGLFRAFAEGAGVDEISLPGVARRAGEASRRGAGSWAQEVGMPDWLAPGLGKKERSALPAAVAPVVAAADIDEEDAYGTIGDHVVREMFGEDAEDAFGVLVTHPPEGAPPSGERPSFVAPSSEDAALIHLAKTHSIGRAHPVVAIHRTDTGVYAVYYRTGSETEDPLYVDLEDLKQLAEGSKDVAGLIGEEVEVAAELYGAGRGFQGRTRRLPASIRHGLAQQKSQRRQHLQDRGLQPTPAPAAPSAGGADSGGGGPMYQRGYAAGQARQSMEHNPSMLNPAFAAGYRAGLQTGFGALYGAKAFHLGPLEIAWHKKTKEEKESAAAKKKEAPKLFPKLGETLKHVFAPHEKKKEDHKLFPKLGETLKHAFEKKKEEAPAPGDEDYYTTTEKSTMKKIGIATDKAVAAVKAKDGRAAGREADAIKHYRDSLQKTHPKFNLDTRPECVVAWADGDDHCGFAPGLSPTGAHKAPGTYGAQDASRGPVDPRVRRIHDLAGTAVEAIHAGDTSGAHHAAALIVAATEELRRQEPAFRLEPHHRRARCVVEWHESRWSSPSAKAECARWMQPGPEPTAAATPAGGGFRPQPRGALGWASMVAPAAAGARAPVPAPFRPQPRWAPAQAPVAAVRSAPGFRPGPRFAPGRATPVAAPSPALTAQARPALAYPARVYPAQAYPALARPALARPRAVRSALSSASAAPAAEAISGLRRTDLFGGLDIDEILAGVDIDQSEVLAGVETETGADLFGDIDLEPEAVSGLTRADLFAE